MLSGDGPEVDLVVDRRRVAVDDDRRDEGNEELMGAVSAFFARNSIPVAVIDDTSMLITSYQGESGDWRCIASVDEEARTFVFYSLLDVDVAEEHRAAVTEFLMRATAGLVVGNFELDIDATDIYFKTSIDVEGDRLSPALIANVVKTNLMVVDHYLPGLLRVAAGQSTAKEAVDQLDGE